MSQTSQQLGSMVVGVKPLAQALRTIKPAIPRTGPSHDQVHIGVEDGDAYIEAGFSLEHARVFFDADVEEIDVVLSAVDLEAVVKDAGKAATLALTVGQDGVSVLVGRRTVVLQDLSADGFIGVHYEPGEKILHGGPAFVDAVKRVATHASTDETRPVLTGVHIARPEGDDAYAVATDSYRLMCSRLLGRVPERTDVLIPAKLLVTALRTVTAGNGVDIYHCGQNTFLVDTGVTQWRGRLIEGQFPNWRQLMPDSFTGSGRVNRLELLDVVVAHARMLKKNEPLRVTLHHPEHLTVRAAGADGPVSEEQVSWSGSGVQDDDELVIGLNGTYLAQALKALDEDEVTIEWLTPLRPILLTAGRDRTLLMPIRVWE